MFETCTVSKYYQEWMKRLEELLPEVRVTQLRVLVLLMLGIAQAGSVQLGHVGLQIGRVKGVGTGSKAKRMSRMQRLWRWLSNSRVEVLPWYEAAIVPWVLGLVKNGCELRLVIDGSKVGFGHQLLLIGICYRKRVIPLCWQWVPHQKGHSLVNQQLQLLKWVKLVLPRWAKVSLVGDSEFSNPRVCQQLDDWGWDYDLRLNGSECVELSDENWSRLNRLVKPGESLELGWVKLTKKHRYWVYVVLHWEKGQDQPWLIVTSRHNLQAALKNYRRRMWIEQTFGDLKGHGFDLEATQLRSSQKLDRLTLAVFLLYLWLVAFGSRIIKLGLRSRIDRTHRRDLSIFRIGYDYFREQVVQDETGRLFLTPV
jgi:hypothetical protein